MMMVEVDSNTTEALLPQITEHYIIVRGFAFAARWMEAYKCKRKKMSRSLKDLEKNTDYIATGYCCY